MHCTPQSANTNHSNFDCPQNVQTTGRLLKKTIGENFREMTEVRASVFYTQKLLYFPCECYTVPIHRTSNTAPQLHEQFYVIFGFHPTKTPQFFAFLELKTAYYRCLSNHLERTKCLVFRSYGKLQIV